MRELDGTVGIEILDGGEEVLRLVELQKPGGQFDRFSCPEYFADGIAEDIITELSRFKSLFVIARNSSFTYKGRAVDVKQVGRELGVRYVLEGSVRRVGPRVRVSAQLINAVSGEHIWSERYDPTAEDIFAVQDELTRKIVAVLPGRVESAAHAHAARKTSQSLESYELLLRAKFLHHLVTPDANR